MTRPQLLFLGISFGLSIALSLIIGLTGGKNSSFINLGIVAFFFPAIAVLIMNWGFDSPVFDAGWRKFSLIGLFAALFVLPIAIHLVALPVTASLNDFQLPWLEWLTPAGDGLYHTPDERGWGTLTQSGLVGRVVLNAVIGLLVVSVLAFFEEIGWRAWMLPRLVQQFDIRIGILLSALIWALWHIPFVFGGIQQIEGIPMWAMLILYPLGLFGAGIFLGWLWLHYESIWIVTLAHGSLNNWGQLAFKYMKEPSDIAGTENLLTFTAVNLALLLVGIFFVFR
ncbi:MAG: CPBP family intramembrane glutamic endopeptidase [Chloroflexota bacterium]